VETEGIVVVPQRRSIGRPLPVGSTFTMPGDTALTRTPRRAVFEPSVSSSGRCALTRSLHRETLDRNRAPGRAGQCVSPGIVKVEPTGSGRPMGPPLRHHDDTPPSPPVTDLTAQTAPGRWIQTQEIADSVIYLCSDAASGVNGRSCS